MSNTPLYPVISLFSGAMGLDLGLEKAGLHIAMTQDVDPWCIETIKKNNHQFIQGDISKILEKDEHLTGFMRKSKVRKKDVFAVVGGPPCQAFSTAGKRKGVSDVRGGLIDDYYKSVKAIKPRFFVMENVKGMTSMKVDPDNPDSQAVSACLIEKFRSLGYHIVSGILDAVHYGAPQFRERLVIIGSRDNEPIFLPAATHYSLHQCEEMRWKTLYDAIYDLQTRPGPSANFSKKITQYLDMIPEGGNWKSLPPELAKTAMGGAYESGGGKVGFFRRLNYSEPSPTLVTSPTQKATLLCHPREIRPLSVKEYARIQGFPDGWKFEGKLTDCYRQIGNAVPIRLGQAIGDMLISVAEGRSEIHAKRMRGTSVHSVMHQLNRKLKGLDD